MPAHRVAKNTNTLAITRKDLRDDSVQLIRYVAFHTVMVTPGCPRGIKIKPRPCTEIPIVVLSRHLSATWAGIGSNQDDPVLSRILLGSGFDHKRLFGAGQARKKKQDRKLPLAKATA